MNKVELTKEQKDCVEYPLDEQILIIDADPGTGKTEILRHRVKFIHQENKKQRKFILILAVGKNISKLIKRKLKEEGLKKVHHQLRSIIPEFSHHQIVPCEDIECPKCLEHNQPIILTFTVHSIAYWMTKQVFAKNFQKRKKIKVLTNAYKKDLSLLYKNNSYPEVNEKIHWTTQEVITRKRKIFSYLINQISKEKLAKEIMGELWKFFREEINIDRESIPYHHWNITNYSEFLEKAKDFLENDYPNFYQELVKVCQENQNKNIWLSFEDMIENVLLSRKNSDIPTNWPVFDYILVDECQDLKRNLLTLITEIFSRQKTNFTFVGDPKQNIMAFAGATENIFQLLKEKFLNCVQKEISISFRVPQEIALMANDFTSKFMPYKPKLTTNQNNGGKKPVVFLGGKEESYQLNAQEEEKIKEKVEKFHHEENNIEDKKLRKRQSLQNKLVKEEIRNKKLKKQVGFILSVINSLDKSFSRVILYRKNEIGNWLKNWFIETNNYDFIVVGDNQNRVIRYIIDKIQNEIKNHQSSLNRFKSIENFLNSLGINWKNIHKFQQIIEKFDQERILDEEKIETNLNEEEINEFIRQIDKQLMERDIENTGKTVLSTIHKAKGLEFDYVFLISANEEILPSENEREWEEVNLFYTAITRTKKELYITSSCWEECSRYIKCLDRNLIELSPTDFPLTPKNNANINHHHLNFPQSMAELFGDEGEEKVFKLLKENKKIKFKKLVKNWQEIEDLQIDIYAETNTKIYFIEVKNWNEIFYHSPIEGLHRQEKIWQQQVSHQEKIAEDFNTSKTIIYLVAFPTGELAHDFQKFLNQKEIKNLLVTHYDKVHTKTWKAEYNIDRIDELIAENEKKVTRKWTNEKKEI